MNCAVKQIKRSIHLRTGDVKLFNNGVATTKRQRGRLVEFTHRMRIMSTTAIATKIALESAETPSPPSSLS